MPKRICRKTKTKEWSRSKIKLSVLLWTQCFYKWKPKLKPKPKLKLHVETTAAADAAAVSHLHINPLQLYIQAHLQFQFQFQHLKLQEDAQLDNISLMEPAFGMLFLFHPPLELPAHQDLQLMKMEPVFQFLHHKSLWVPQFQFLLALKDGTMMEMETALLQLMLLHQYMHLHNAHLDTRPTEMETVLHLMFHIFASPDTKLMDKEVAFQLLLLKVFLL